MYILPCWGVSRSHALQGSKAWRRMHRFSPASLAEPGHLSDSSIPSTSSLRTTATFLSPQLPRRSQARAVSPSGDVEDEDMDQPDPPTLTLNNGPLSQADASISEVPAPKFKPKPKVATSLSSPPAANELRHRHHKPQHAERDEDHAPHQATMACDFGRTLLDQVSLLSNRPCRLTTCS
jgi:hypothetical protein